MKPNALEESNRNMEVFKIAITGDVGVGKTSFIRTISEIEVVDTERRTTDKTALLKENTTVAFDFGRLTLNSEQLLYLYGTPGQARFDFMWDMIIKRVDAYVLLVDAHRPQQFRSCRRIFNFMNQRVAVPYIVGVTHLDCEEAWKPEDVALAIGFTSATNRPPLVEVNANDSSSVAQCLVTLLEQMMPSTVVS